MSAEIKNLKNLQNTEYGLKKLFDEAEDFLPLLGTDYVELYVGNAKQSAHYYKTAFGFQSEAYAGLETGVKDRVSYVLKQDKIRLVLTTPLNEGGVINEHINKHGDGVKVVALWVEDATKAWEETTKRGAKSFMEPTEEEAKDQFGFLMNAFEYGAPPHGGIAFGFDRLCSLFGGQESIRDFIAFPKNNSGRDVMIDAPSIIDNAQLDELNIKLK